jgi:hypothetical protein
MLLKRLQRWSNWNSATAQRQRRKGQRSAKLAFQLQLELLEQRTLPSAVFTPAPYTVPTNNADVAGWPGSPLTLFSGSPAVEPLMLVNPNNPANLILSSHNGLSVSTNGGRTYSAPLTFPDQANVGNNGDSATVFTSQGKRLFWANLGTPTTVGGQLTVYITEVDPLRGTQIGTTHQVSFPPAGIADDKPFLASDSNGNLFITWIRLTAPTTVLLARSTNGGATWEAPVTVSGAKEGYDWPSTVSVASNGDVFVAYHSTPLSGNFSADADYVARYTNDLKTQISKTFALLPGQASRRGTYPGTDFDPTGVAQPWVLTDPARPSNVYVIAVNDDARGGAGDPADVVSARSTDSGKTWTASNVESGPNNSMQLFVTAAIDRFGDIAIAWYDNRAGLLNAKGNFLWDVYAKYSKDGGLTWSTAFKVSDRPLDPDTANPPDPNKGVPRIDDYFGIGLFGDKAYVAWEGNTFLAGKVTGDTLMTDSFDIRGALTYTDPFAVGQFGPGHGTHATVTLQALPLNPRYFELFEGASLLYVGQWSNMTGTTSTGFTNITINAVFGNDVVRIENTGSAVGSGIPVTVNFGAGDDTAFVSPTSNNLSGISGDLTLHGGAGVNSLYIFDQGSDRAFNPVPLAYDITQFTLQRRNLNRIRGQSSSPTGLITYDGFSGGVVIDGGDLGNHYNVAGSPVGPMTINTGLGADTVNVLATTGNVTVNGESGLDTVNIGSGGSVRNIGKTLTVTNPGSYSAVTVDDSADSVARTVIMYNNGVLNGSYTVISGLTPGGDIVLRGLDLRSLKILAGSGGNTFRIHDTPASPTPGGVTTTISAGAGPDNVTIDGTTGALALDVQGAPQGANYITVGSPTVGLNSINGKIDITGATGVVNNLLIEDSGSTVSHDYVINQNVVQRLDKARISYQHMSSLNLRAGTGHIFVQDTMPLVSLGSGTTISGGDDRIDVGRTTGALGIYPGVHSVVTVGNATSSLDNIKGGIAMFGSPSVNLVTLNLDDQAARMPEQLDISRGKLGILFQRSGAAYITVPTTMLASFVWTSGSGGTIFHEYVRPAQLTKYNLGNDVLNIGTPAGTISDFGPISVVGGIGPDAVMLNDSGENGLQTYNVSQASGHETFTTRGTTLDLGLDIETFDVRGGAGGNIVKIAGTIAGMSTTVHTGAGLDAVTVGGTGNSLQAIQGPLTIDSQGGTNTLNVNDQGNSVPEEYLIDTATIRRANTSTHIVDATIDYSGFAAVVLNGSSGGDSSDSNIFQVAGTPAGTSMTLNGGPGVSEFVIGYPMDAIQGPLSLHGHSGHDFALFNDSTDPTSRTFTLTSTQLATSGIAPIGFDGLVEVVLSGGAGSDAFNIQSVAPGVFVSVGAGAGDSVVIGSQAPTLGGTLANILGPVRVTSAAGTPVAVTVDDSGDAVSRQVFFTADTSFGTGIVAEDITGLAPATIILELGSGAATTVLAGSGNNTFNVEATQVDAPLTINLGAGDDAVTVGSTSNNLDAILGALTLNGQGGLDAVTFNDQGTTTVQEYTLSADQLTRTDANSVPDMAPISLATLQAITLNVSSGDGSVVFVESTAAGVSTTVNGNAGSQVQFSVDASSNGILGPVILHGHNANADFAQYFDIGNTAPHTYTLTSTSVSRDGQAPVVFDGLFSTILYAPMVGGNTVNVNSVAAGSGYKIQAANGDHVTVGSLAPGLGGTLANILDQVNVVSYTPNDAVSLVLDDSGNTDTTAAKHITFVKDTDGNTSLVGLTPLALSWLLPSASSVTVLGGAANEIFSMQSFVADTPLTIVGGTGSNTLDYSSYTTDVSVNLQTGTATDLAGISDPNTGRVTIQNVIGGSGNDTLTAGADRSILIGGGGADHLFGGSGEGLLIAGTTDYTHPNLDAAAFDAIVQEWNRTDLSFDDRMSDLMTGSNAGGVAAKNVVGGTAILLNGTTVHDDLAASVLTGGTGRDWYFIGASDLIMNQKHDDAVTMV